MCGQTSHPVCGSDSATRCAALVHKQREWLTQSLAASKALFKFPVSGSSWNCGGVESWNHAYTHEYDALLESIRETRTSGVILLGGDQHNCKIAVRPRESWEGYDLHEWMAGQLWNLERDQNHRGFGIITVDTTVTPATAKLEFFDQHGKPRPGKRIPYTTPGALRALWDSPSGKVADRQRAADGEIRRTTPLLWDALPAAAGETLTSDDLRFP